MAIEKELKYSLERADYLKLLKLSKKGKCENHTQRNYYFDTDSLALRKKGFSLRIRLTGENENAELTVKSPAKNKLKMAGYKVQTEMECELPTAIASKVIANEIPIKDIATKPTLFLFDAIPGSTKKRLKCLGELKTTRKKFTYQRGILFELDASEVFGKKFYELEVETASPVAVDKEIRKLFKKLEIPYLPSDRSKIGRFLSGWTSRNRLSRSFNEERNIGLKDRFFSFFRR